MTLILGLYLFFYNVVTYCLWAPMFLLRLVENKEGEVLQAHHLKYLTQEPWDKVDIPPLGFALTAPLKRRGIGLIAQLVRATHS